jgi:tRNA (Thr-GGU) A37 N-methylase
MEGRILSIEDVDILDGTPLLDIKPYVNQFDFRESEKQGWLEKNGGSWSDTLDDGRFAAEH